MSNTEPTNDPSNYPHSPGVVVVPTDEDVNVLRGILNDAYTHIREEYEAPRVHQPDDQEVRERVERKGSLIQELLAQLRAIEDE